ncbi:hypothetical protein [Bacillus alveayuensis]|uniref:Uncharacterized protein n=1 Tax=Aeribacillus alveayuensis TaxID=279215 RepID=A0ABT9VMS2_9BACI|nr:hypothetical protein [Bacillus alveayuensis]MDQ0162282.1 hypothetical protein [Bacillus alveayuensis]
MAKNQKKNEEPQIHQKRLDKRFLQEEFGGELGDYNAHKIYDLLAKENKGKKEDKCSNKEK